MHKYPEGTLSRYLRDLFTPEDPEYARHDGGMTVGVIWFHISLPCRTAHVEYS
ncbi:hypothetical protein E4U48_001300 [Claviceps purpurea]|nr:hypothetical protein E4U48_001300 [Claviceps purpurea]